MSKKTTILNSEKLFPRIILSSDIAQKFLSIKETIDQGSQYTLSGNWSFDNQSPILTITDINKPQQQMESDLIGPSFHFPLLFDFDNGQSLFTDGCVEDVNNLMVPRRIRFFSFFIMNQIYCFVRSTSKPELIFEFLYPNVLVSAKLLNETDPTIISSKWTQPHYKITNLHSIKDHTAKEIKIDLYNIDSINDTIVLPLALSISKFLESQDLQLPIIARINNTGKIYEIEVQDSGWFFLDCTINILKCKGSNSFPFKIHSDDQEPFSPSTVSTNSSTVLTPSQSISENQKNEMVVTPTDSLDSPNNQFNKSQSHYQCVSKEDFINIQQQMMNQIIEKIQIMNAQVVEQLTTTFNDRLNALEARINTLENQMTSKMDNITELFDEMNETMIETPKLQPSTLPKANQRQIRKVTSPKKTITTSTETLIDVEPESTINQTTPKNNSSSQSLKANPEEKFSTPSSSGKRKAKMNWPQNSTKLSIIQKSSGEEKTSLSSPSSKSTPPVNPSISSRDFNFESYNKQTPKKNITPVSLKGQKFSPSVPQNTELYSSSPKNDLLPSFLKDCVVNLDLPKSMLEQPGSNQLSDTTFRMEDYVHLFDPRGPNPNLSPSFMQ